MISLIFEMIFKVAANFTVGMFGALFIFLWRLPGIIFSYQPSWVSTQDLL